MALVDDHSELYHYTGIAGLKGILESQTLWATHAGYLNDASELQGFKGRLHAVIKSAIARVAYEDIQDQDAEIARISERFADNMYRIMFGGGDTEPMAEPYITSFCRAHRREEARSNGLLSQWRGYWHGGGGYALVFDVHGLEALLEEEGKRYASTLFAGDVVYSWDADDRIGRELGSDMDVIADRITRAIKFRSDTELGDTHDALARCACRYKHWGFHEEEEVRIVFIRMGRALLSRLAEQRVPYQQKPQRHYMRNGTLIPCVHLFEGVTRRPSKALPITRIIVGPHPEKDRRRRSLQDFVDSLELDIPVEVSEIPYVGPYAQS